jgi:hypothetical protein
MRAIGYRSYGAGSGVSGGLLLMIYLLIGAFVAATHHYYAHLHLVKQYGSAALAIVLWPLLLLGINLHIH